MSEVVPEKKKRGRKPKVVTITDNAEPEADKVYHKRGRRPKVKSIDPDTSEKKYSLLDLSNKRVSSMLDICIIHLKIY
ncbi:MAG: hypothetical protein F3739_07925 [Nitrospinae bacterium]|nr:hypothetical protein [Nitrospinota bacterium]